MRASAGLLAAAVREGFAVVSPAGFAIAADAGLLAGFSVAATGCETVTSGRIVFSRVAGMPDFDRSPTLAYGRAAMILLAYDGPMPSTVSNSAALAVLRSTRAAGFVFWAALAVFDILTGFSAAVAFFFTVSSGRIFCDRAGGNAALGQLVDARVRPLGDNLLGVRGTNAGHVFQVGGAGRVDIDQRGRFFRRGGRRGRVGRLGTPRSWLDCRL